MGAYGVPDTLDGALPWVWAQQRLAKCRNYWIVTASADARPHAMPTWGIWLEDRERFFFSCAPSSRKHRNLLANPQIVVAADDTVECVSLEGIAGVCDPTSTEVRDFVTRWATKYEPDDEKRVAMIEFVFQNALWLVTPQRAFGIIEREAEFGPTATRWVW